jgi:hypothetical protein
MNLSGSCRLCGRTAPLVESHIIPKGLYWGLDQEAFVDDIVNNGKIIRRKGDRHKAPVVVSTVPGEFQKRRPIGLWGRFICQTCEARFNDWDSHAIAVFRDARPQPVFRAWKYENFEYAKLKLFFISLLWRAAVTEEPFFEKAVLEARDLQRLKLLIKKSRPSSWTEYSVLLWRSDEIIAKAIIPPKRVEHEGLSFIRIYFPGYMALIKVDHRSLPVRFKPYSLNETGSWFVGRRDYSTSEEWKLMLDAVRKTRKK